MPGRESDIFGDSGEDNYPPLPEERTRRVVEALRNYRVRQVYLAHMAVRVIKETRDFATEPIEDLLLSAALYAAEHETVISYWVASDGKWEGTGESAFNMELLEQMAVYYKAVEAGQEAEWPKIEEFEI